MQNGGAAGTAQAVKMWTESMSGWSTFASPKIEGMFPPGQDLLCFWAKGDARTKQLLVEVGETDGSRWMAVVPLTARWTYHVLAPEVFHYWPDARVKGRRGGEGDHFHPRNGDHIVLGLAQSHTPAVGGGPHAFWVDQIGTAAHPYADLTTKAGEAFPSLETITPSYKTYPLEKVAALVAAPGQAVLDASWNQPPPSSLYSAIVRPSGKGFGNERKWRWVPLIEARDAAGERRGTAAWLLLNQAPPFQGSIFAAFGVCDPKTLRSEPWSKAVVETVRRMRQGVFLSEGGARSFSLWPGEKAELGATVLNWGAAPATVTARLTVVAKETGKSLFRAEEPLTVPPGESKSLTRTWDPAGFSGDCEVTTELIQGQTVLDRIAHSLGFLSNDPPRPEEFVKVRDGNFVVQGKPWYPIGINYWALYVSGLDPHDYNGGWFNPAFYDPEEVELDLQRMKALGIDMVSIQLGHPNSQRNLLDFLRRCRRYGVRVNGFLGGASPIGFNETEVKEFLRAGKLVENPVLFAYDIIWEPGNSMFNADGRKRWDRDWEAWIVERYGSLANAEADWGMPAPREEGQVVSPSERQLREDGPWRVHGGGLSPLHGRPDEPQVERRGHAPAPIDPNHLISFRQGNTLPHDFALTATVKHIDFICPEGYSIPQGRERRERGRVPHALRGLHHGRQADLLGRVRPQRLGRDPHAPRPGRDRRPGRVQRAVLPRRPRRRRERYRSVVVARRLPRQRA